MSSDIDPVRLDSVRVGFPVECLKLRLTVDPVRWLNPFEWAVETLVDEFPVGNRPARSEIRRQLGIGSVGLLDEILTQLVRTEIVRRSPDVGEDGDTGGTRVTLRNAQLTERGRLLLAKGKTAGVPFRVGLELRFDALSQRPLASPPKTRVEPLNPVGDPEEYQPRAGIGLKLVRQRCVELGLPHHRGDSRVSEVVLLSESSRIEWLLFDADLLLDADGTLRLQLRSGDPERQMHLDAFDLDFGWLDDLLSRVPEVLRSALLAMETPPIDLKTWNARRVLDPLGAESVEAHAVSLVKAAQSEVIVDRAWHELPEVAAEVDRAVERNVRCYLLGGVELEASRWGEAGCDGSFGCLVTVPAAENGASTLLLVDGDQGLALDRLPTRTQRGTARSVMVCTVLRRDAVPALRESLVPRAVPMSETHPRQVCLAMFALTGERRWWERCVEAAAEAGQGLDDELLRLARSHVEPVEVLDALLLAGQSAPPAPEPATRNPEPLLTRVAVLARMVAAGWSAETVLEQCAEFVNGIDLCLVVAADRPPQAAAVQSVLAELAQQSGLVSSLGPRLVGWKGQVHRVALRLGFAGQAAGREGSEDLLTQLAPLEPGTRAGGSGGDGADNSGNGAGARDRSANTERRSRRKSEKRRRSSNNKSKTAGSRRAA